MSTHQSPDLRQRFYVQHSPVRGEHVCLQQAYQHIGQMRDYPSIVRQFLGEMLAGVALIANQLKMKGRISLQARGNEQGFLTWAMAECNHVGEVRALAQWQAHAPLPVHDANTPCSMQWIQGGVLFLNIEPEQGQRYQGIIAIEKETLAECLADYYDYSAQLPTRIHLAANADCAAGLLLQLLPRTEDEEFEDADLWPRMQMLTSTLHADELLTLSARDVLHRLYHEEDIVLDTPEELRFGCTCSREKCVSALVQLGEEEMQSLLEEKGSIDMDCQFCGTVYAFNTREALAIIGRSVS